MPAQDSQVVVVTLAQLNTPLKETMEGAKKDLLPIYQTLGKYSKALDKVRALDFRNTVCC